jgi:hypothetical protein
MGLSTLKSIAKYKIKAALNPRVGTARIWECLFAMQSPWPDVDVQFPLDGDPSRRKTAIN